MNTPLDQINIPLALFLIALPILVHWAIDTFVSDRFKHDRKYLLFRMNYPIAILISLLTVVAFWLMLFFE